MGSLIDGARAATPALAPDYSIGDDLTAHVSALTRLHDLAMRLAGPVERDAALTDIVSTLVELNGARFGLLSIFDPDASVLRIAASAGFSPAAIARLDDVAPGPLAGACGCAFATRTRAIVEDTESDPRFARFRDIAR